MLLWNTSIIFVVMFAVAGGVMRISNLRLGINFTALTVVISIGWNGLTPFGRQLEDPASSGSLIETLVETGESSSAVV
jgi:hypothetical protein